jgi:hypothetical protein
VIGVRERPLGLRFGHAEVFALLGAATFLAARCLPLLSLNYQCPFRALTGLPCASCGMTHAFVHLAHGAPGAAWAANPLGALLAAGFWAYAVLDLVRVVFDAPFPRLGSAACRALAVTGIVALLVNWAWLLHCAGVAR